MQPVMQYRQLGNTGLRVSLVGLGTVKLGRNVGVRYPHNFTIPDDAQAARLLDTARELGINLLDTAPAYGSSEARLGALLGAQRDDWVLSTKVGERFEALRSVSASTFVPVRCSRCTVRIALPPVLDGGNDSCGV